MAPPPDEPHRSHDTDPLADTQSSDETDSSAASSSTVKRRQVDQGDTLAHRYELGENIGEGGMATVYRAKDKELRREVAIKVLFPHLARRDEVVRRFLREARAAAGLEHPNILRVYDVGGAGDATKTGGVESDDPPYIVMELIRGRSLLGELEAKGPMLAEVAACVGAVLADALGVAHKAGIIHRDVKPANVMIAGDGRVLLTDFGVARLETEDSLVTKTGALLGTPAYMSPEQAGGDTATAKSDLYSLGATLYQLATGHLPYSGSPAKVMAQIAQGPPTTAVRRRAAVGPDLSKVIERLMSHDPTGRPANAEEVAIELRLIASSGGLGDARDELKAYFADADNFVKDRTPSVVSALLKSANRAIAEEKLPRAMALADRASALAPDDPQVTALISAVTEGGKASRRKKMFAIVGASVVVAGAGTLGLMKLMVKGEPAIADAPLAIATAFEAGVDSAPMDTIVVASTEIDAGVPIDAGRVRVDGGGRVRADAAIDAGRVAAPDDANKPLPVSIDAAVPVVAQQGTVIVKSDAWCNVTIDDIAKGRAQNSLTVTNVDAGKHTVKCEQSGVGTKPPSWTREVDVVGGKSVTVQGSLLGTVMVTFEVDATVDGIGYTKGQSVPLPVKRSEIMVGGKKKFLTFRTNCTLRTTPELDCY